MQPNALPRRLRGW